MRNGRETAIQRIKRTLRENAVIVFGCGFTVFSAFKLAQSLRRNDKPAFQLFQRLRIAGSWFTLSAIAYSHYYKQK